MKTEENYNVWIRYFQITDNPEFEGVKEFIKFTKTYDEAMKIFRSYNELQKLGVIKNLQMKASKEIFVYGDEKENPE